MVCLRIYVCAYIAWWFIPIVPTIQNVGAGGGSYPKVQDQPGQQHNKAKFQGKKEK
jgi:hypothetical protein